MHWLINSVPNLISTARVSATRNLHVACRSSVVAQSLGCHKIITGFSIAYVSGFALALLLKGTR